MESESLLFPRIWWKLRVEERNIQIRIGFWFPGLAGMQSGTILVGKNLQNANISVPTTFSLWTLAIVVFVMKLIKYVSS